MNKNKLIFAIIGWILVLFLVVWLLFLKGWVKKKTTTKSASWDFTIWIVWDSKVKFEEFLSTFKEANRGVSNVDYKVESFSKYADYSRALTSAMIQGKAPDVFVLNNNETSLFENKILPIASKEINVTSFRKDYKWIFNDDLIILSGESDSKGNKEEFLKWIPVWYETLGIFYNRRFRFKASDFNSIASLNWAIERIKRNNVIPLGIWNGTTVEYSPDILAQFFLLHKVDTLSKANTLKIKQAVWEYAWFWTVNWDNAYNWLYSDTKLTGKSNIDLFAGNDVASIITYPRSILKLQALGFSKKTLFATKFPHFHSWDGWSLANYNFFVINSDSAQQEIALTLLKYLNTDEWAEAYLEKYKYYLPARLSLESDMSEQKISNYFENVVLWDFYSENPLSSFDKANKVIYDRDVISVLDNFSSYLSAFDSFKSSTLCKSNKILNLTNLWESCE